jgi:hypothetical protein
MRLLELPDLGLAGHDGPDENSGDALVHENSYV